MSTLEATVAMLKSMPKEARVLVFQYTQSLFTSRKPASPFTPVSTEQVFSDLAESRQQIADGKGIKCKQFTTSARTTEIPSSRS